MRIFRGGGTDPKSQAPSLNNSHLTTVRPYNSPVSSQDLTSVTTLSLYATCYYSVTFPCYERTNIQTCTSRKTKDEMRSPKLTTPTFTLGDSITILRMMFHYCPKHFTDSTPNLYLMFVGSWLRHCYGAKERNLKDGKYVQCVWFITTYISTNIPAHRVAR